MTYQLYRNTTLGNTLQESLDELIQVIEFNRIFFGNIFIIIFIVVPLLCKFIYYHGFRIQ